MIRRKDIISRKISPATAEMAKVFASQIGFPGRSYVRNGEERKDHLEEDDWVGQIGSLVGTKFSFGSLTRYVMARDEANKDRYKGDGGADILGGNVDFKTSVMRGSPDPMEYHLIVPPAERHPGIVYLRILLYGMDKIESGDLIAHIVGWLADEDLPIIGTVKRFAEKHCVPVPDLNPVMPLRWSFYID